MINSQYQAAVAVKRFEDIAVHFLLKNDDMLSWLLWLDSKVFLMDLLVMFPFRAALHTKPEL